MPEVDHICHHACDCREAAFAELVELAKEMSAILATYVPQYSKTIRYELKTLLARL